MKGLLALLLKALTIVGVVIVTWPRPPKSPAPAQPTAAPAPSQAHADSAVPRPGWSKPLPATTPRPTYWPFVLALGVTFGAWGIVSTWFIAVVGLLLVVIAIAGWIGELLHESA